MLLQKRVVVGSNTNAENPELKLPTVWKMGVVVNQQAGELNLNFLKSPKFTCWVNCKGLLRNFPCGLKKSTPL